MQIGVPTQFLASSIFSAIKESIGVDDNYFEVKGFYDTLLFHYHGGTSPEIAWNDVQAIESINKFAGRSTKLAVPSFPSEAYNKHGHTSEYDGGVLAGITGNHNHRDNRNGGFCFAVFAPATGVAQTDWES